MCKKQDIYKYVCHEPRSEERAQNARHVWRELTGRTVISSARRLVQQPDRATKQDWFRCVGSTRGGVALLTLLGMLRSLQLRHNVVSLLAKAVALLIEPNGNLLFPGSVLTQTFEGEVTSVSDADVIIQFRVADDLEDRRVKRRELSRDLEEGQPVQVKCHLELVLPSEPLMDEAIRDFENKYRELDEVLKEVQFLQDTYEEVEQ